MAALQVASQSKALTKPSVSKEGKQRMSELSPTDRMCGSDTSHVTSSSRETFKSHYHPRHLHVSYVGNTKALQSCGDHWFLLLPKGEIGDDFPGWRYGRQQCLPHLVMHISASLWILLCRFQLAGFISEATIEWILTYLPFLLSS